MCYVTFALLSHYFLIMSRVRLFVINIKVIFLANLKAFTHQKV